METTLKKLQAINFDNLAPDTVNDLYRFLNKTQPDDEPLAILKILEAVGFRAALRCMVAVDVVKYEKRQLRLNYAFVQEVTRFMPQKSLDGLQILKLYYENKAPVEQFLRAHDSVREVIKDWLTEESSLFVRDCAALAAQMAFFGDPLHVADKVMKICEMADYALPFQQKQENQLKVQQKQENQLKEILTLKVA
jgi:hypothetical protein